MALTINTQLKNEANEYLLDARYVKGGYTVVAGTGTDTKENLPAATQVEGSLVYDAAAKKSYRYTAGAWVEEQSAKADDVPNNIKYREASTSYIGTKIDNSLILNTLYVNPSAASDLTAVLDDVTFGVDQENGTVVDDTEGDGYYVWAAWDGEDTDTLTTIAYYKTIEKSSFCDPTEVLFGKFAGATGQAILVTAQLNGSAFMTIGSDTNVFAALIPIDGNDTFKRGTVYYIVYDVSSGEPVVSCKSVEGLTSIDLNNTQTSAVNLPESFGSIKNCMYYNDRFISLLSANNDFATETSNAGFVLYKDTEELANQDTPVDIKTINGNSLIGTGDVALELGTNIPTITVLASQIISATDTIIKAQFTDEQAAIVENLDYPIIVLDGRSLGIDGYTMSAMVKTPSTNSDHIMMVADSNAYYGPSDTQPLQIAGHLSYLAVYEKSTKVATLTSVVLAQASQIHNIKTIYINSSQVTGTSETGVVTVQLTDGQAEILEDANNPVVNIDATNSGIPGVTACPFLKTTTPLDNELMFTNIEATYTPGYTSLELLGGTEFLIIYRKDTKTADLTSKDLTFKEDLPVITANPTEDATDELTKLTVGDTTYSIITTDNLSEEIEEAENQIEVRRVTLANDLSDKEFVLTFSNVDQTVELDGTTYDLSSSSATSMVTIYNKDFKTMLKAYRVISGTNYTNYIQLYSLVNDNLFDHELNHGLGHGGEFSFIGSTTTASFTKKLYLLKKSVVEKVTNSIPAIYTPTATIGALCIGKHYKYATTSDPIGNTFNSFIEVPFETNIIVNPTTASTDALLTGLSVGDTLYRNYGDADVHDYLNSGSWGKRTWEAHLDGSWYANDLLADNVNIASYNGTGYDYNISAIYHIDADADSGLTEGVAYGHSDYTTYIVGVDDNPKYVHPNGEAMAVSEIVLKDDYTKLSGYDASKAQLLGHDATGALCWYDKD